MCICEEARDLWILNVPNDWQRHCHWLRHYRRHEVTGRFNDCCERRRLLLVRRGAAGIHGAALRARSRRTLAGHLTGSRNSEQWLRSSRNDQQQNHQRVFHEIKTHGSTFYSRDEHSAPHSMIDGRFPAVECEADSMSPQNSAAHARLLGFRQVTTVRLRSYRKACKSVKRRSVSSSVASAIAKTRSHVFFRRLAS